MRNPQARVAYENTTSERERRQSLSTAPVTVSAAALPVPALAEQRGDEHPALVYLARLSPGSRATMRGALDAIAGRLTAGAADHIIMPWQQLRYQHTAALRTVLAETYAPATANKMLAALRGVLKEAWRLGLLPAEEFHRAADLPGVRGSTLPRGRALAAGELRALFDVCGRDASPAGARDAALLAILYGCGTRRAEAAAADVEDFDLETGELRIRRGKGRKDRLTYGSAGARAAVARWLLLRGEAPGPLLLPVRKGGQLQHRRMTTQAIYYALQRRAAAAGVATFSPHDLRRTFISDLLDAGADISTVQKLAGHENVQTTQRYDRRPEKAKQRAVELLHVPFAA